jgi:cell volume regulation protein A
MDDGRVLLIAGALLAVALLASLVAGRFRVPGLLVFLGIGMAAGTDGAGLIEFSDYARARDVGVVALVLILFEGGLASGWNEIRPVFWPAASLAVLGTLITAVITGLAATLLLDLSTLQGLLLGSIVASTDSAAIFAALRGSTLRRKLARTLEGEAGFNDPVAVLLVLGFIEWIQRDDYGVGDMALLLATKLLVGTAVGLAIGFGSAWTLRRVRLASAGLYPVASVATVGLAFGGAEVLHGSGFLAVYLAGLVLGTVATPARRTITTFHDGLAWVAQLALFLTLGLLVFPSQLGDVAVRGLILTAVLIFVARPVSTLLATTAMGFALRERLALGWAGLRGGVPVVLATFPVLEGLPGSLEFFNLVFFAVLVSTIVQGTSFETVGRLLGVTTQEAALPAPLVDPVTVRRLGAEIVEYPVAESDAVAGRHVRQLELPREALLNVIVRGDQAIAPRGSTVVEAGDRLHVLVRQEVALEFRALLTRWRSGPMDAATGEKILPRRTLFTMRPWRVLDGDPTQPRTVDGVEVRERLRTRRDQPGSLVSLVDGRFAFLGPIVAVGPPRALQDAARRRLLRAADDAERAWWREVIGALATS